MRESTYTPAGNEWVAPAEERFEAATGAIGVVSAGTEIRGRIVKQDYLQIRVLELEPEVYASGQLFEDDLRLVAKQGVRTIVNTRPDNETPGQPSSSDLASVAGELGMSVVHFPVDSSSMTREQAEAFAEMCTELERPLIVFGRSGASSTKIWETADSL